MKKVLTMSLIAVIGLAAYGCTKTEKINASATTAQCDGVNNDRACCGSVDCAVRKLANAKLAATGDSSDCPLWGTPACPLAAKAAAAKAKPAAAGNANNRYNCKTEVDRLEGCSPVAVDIPTKPTVPPGAEG